MEQAAKRLGQMSLISELSRAQGSPHRLSCGLPRNQMETTDPEEFLSAENGVGAFKSHS